MSAAEEIVSRIKSRMVIGQDVDLDAYADSDEAAYIKPASEFMDQVWEHRNRPPIQKGGLLPWSKTHSEVQIPRGCLTLWAGKRGQGKSLVTNNVFLGLINRGERVVIAPTEMPVMETLERLENQALGTGNPTREFQKEFYRWANGKLWLYDEPEGVSPARRMLGLCRYSIEELGANHVLIDSLMMVRFNARTSFEKNEEQIDFARSLQGIAKATGANTHLVTHFKKAQHGGREDGDSIKGSGDLPDLASNVFFVSANLKKQDEANKPPHMQKPEVMEEADVWLKVEKQRHGPSGGNFALWLHPGSLQLLPSKSAPVRPLVSVNGGSE